MTTEFDSWDLDSLVFARCARGFVLRGDYDAGLESATFAFDRIEDLAAWLVDQYGEPSEASDAREV